MTRVSVVAAVVVLGIGCGTSETAPRGAILIVVDTLRADHVGLYGSERGLTPRIDELAESSVVFRNTLASSSWTRPSVASMMTGRYPTTIDVLDDDDAISGDLETLAETLASSGVRTLALSSNPIAGAKFGFAQGFASFEESGAMEKLGYDNQGSTVTAKTITARALDLVDELDTEEQFFLFLHYSDPHMPYLAHPGLLDEAEPKGRFSGSRADLKALSKLKAGDKELDRARIRYLYEGEVKYCDLWLGELFDGLEDRGLFDELLVVVTSDHGEGLWDHGPRGHGNDLYEELIQVPLVIRFPQTTSPSPSVVESFASHVDVAPTILGSFGIEVPADYQGRDLGAALRSRKIDQRRDFGYSEMRYKGVDFESISDGQTKIIRNRAFDGSKAEASEYVVQKGDTLSSVLYRFSGVKVGRRELTSPLNRAVQMVFKKGRSGPRFRRARRRLLAANPQLDAQSGDLPVGATIRIPALPPPRSDDDLHQVFLLDQDPAELQDRSGENLAVVGDLLPLMRGLGTENLVLRIQGEKVDLDRLDRATREQLEALGYLGDG